MKANNKDINFEINLLPVISLLAVCISFLLLTTVWVKIGTLDVKQALGSSSEVLSQREAPALWVVINDAGDMILQLKNMASQKQKQYRFTGNGSEAQLSQLLQFAEGLKQSEPELNVALVFPDRLTSFDNVIKTIDLLKKSNISDVGIAPL